MTRILRKRHESFFRVAELVGLLAAAAAAEKDDEALLVLDASDKRSGLVLLAISPKDCRTPSTSQ